MTRQRKTILKFGGTGFLVSCFVFVLGYCMNRPSIHLSLETYGLLGNLCLIICPPSLGLMATEQAHGAVLAVVMFEIAALNAGLYSIVGWLGVKLEKLTRRA